MNNSITQFSRKLFRRELGKMLRQLETMRLAADALELTPQLDAIKSAVKDAQADIDCGAGKERASA